MKSEDVVVGEVLWTRASGVKAQVKVLRVVEGNSCTFGKRKRTTWVVRSLKTNRELSRSAAALHKHENFKD